MQIYVDGSAVRLDKRHYIGQGGEGAVYCRGDTAYKIYQDPSKVIPVAKIQELAAIQDPRVIRPLKVITDRKGRPRGYTMRYCRAVYTLCQLFPRTFRDREGLDAKAVTHLVRELQEGIGGVHAAGVLLVDLNEMNFLVDRSFTSIYFIDADSYQTGSFPATALMESVRDRHMRHPHDFSILTDWFSFSIVSFQLFCGIHPFKGKHPKLKGLDARMQANVSVFSSDVRVPRSAYPVDSIPQRYRDWYRAVFEDGKRVAPPTDMGAVIVVVPDTRTIRGTEVLDIQEIFSFGTAIKGYWTSGQSYCLATSAGTVLDGHAVPAWGQEPVAVQYSPARKKAVAVCRDGQQLQLYCLQDRKVVPFAFEPTAIMQHDDRVYLKGRDNVYELVLTDAGQQVVATTQLACSCLEHATQMFPGVVVQNLLGSVHVSVFPVSGVTYQTMLKELDPYRIVDARYDRGVLMVVGEKSGRYDRLVFRFSYDHQQYDVRTVEDIVPTGLNFVVLDNDVVVLINESDQLEISLRDRGSTKIKIVEDPAVGGDVRLVRHQGQLGFYRGNVLYRMRLRR